MPNHYAKTSSRNQLSNPTVSVELMLYFVITFFTDLFSWSCGLLSESSKCTVGSLIMQSSERRCWGLSFYTYRRIISAEGFLRTMEEYFDRTRRCWYHRTSWRICTSLLCGRYFMWRFQKQITWISTPPDSVEFSPSSALRFWNFTPHFISYSTSAVTD